MKTRIFVPIALGFALTLTAHAQAPGGTVTASPEKISPAALREIRGLEEEKKARTPAQRKMDSNLVYAHKKLLTGAASAAAPHMESMVKVEADGRVLVDISATVSDDLLAFIRKKGGEIISSFAKFKAIRALVPLPAIESIAGRADVRFVDSAHEAVYNASHLDVEGDICHEANLARAAFGVDGTGVKVGVLSNSDDKNPPAVASGDLPNNIITLPGESGSTNDDSEGTAMLEVVYRLAPGAQLYYATGDGGDANMANNILALQAAGCNIIVDDVTYPDESPFQDQAIAQAVDAVSASNVLYFSSAANSGNLTTNSSSCWEGDFSDGGAVDTSIFPNPGKMHNFGGGTNYETVSIGPTSTNNVTLFWSDPLGGSDNDYDLFILDSNGTTVLRSSTNPQTGSQDPYEFIGTLLNGERIVVVQNTGAANRFLHLNVSRTALLIQTDGNTLGHNSCGAPNAFSVAATPIYRSYPNPFTGGGQNPIEAFSSDGPRRIFFNPDGSAITPGNFSSTGGLLLPKPDITAADGVTNSIFFAAFYGTSCAAPHAAAIAALIESYAPGYTPAQVREVLESTALVIAPPVPNRDSGYGIAMAFQALASIDPCTLTCPTNITQNNDSGQCGATVTYTAPGTAGFCSSVTCSPSSGSVFPVGITSVTCTSVTGVTCSFNVTVKDVEPPTITCPANITSNTTPDLCSAVVNWPPPAIHDNCLGATVACVPPSGSTFDKGTNQVVCTATDASGNTNSCGFAVMVVDNQPPSISCPTNIVTGSDPGQCGAVVNWAAPAVTDNCPGATVACVPPSGSLFSQGTANVTCTATDSSGNQKSCFFTVTVTQPAVCGIEASGSPGGLTICKGSTVVLTAANGMKTYLWHGPEQDGATVRTIVVSTAGTYTCTQAQYYGSTNCCSVTVIVNPPPNATITGNLVITNGLPTTLVGPSGLASQYWTGPQNNGLASPSNTVIDPGVYTLHVSDSNGCQNTGSVTVLNQTPAPCSITASGDGVSVGSGGATICQGFTVVLTGANGMSSYLWSGPQDNGATAKSIRVGNQGTYTVQQIDGMGLTNSCSLFLTVHTAPAVTIYGIKTICQGTNTTLSGPSGMTQYLWLGPQNNGLTAPSNTVSFPGTYTLTVTDSNGCQNSVSVPVTTIVCP